MRITIKNSLIKDKRNIGERSRIGKINAAIAMCCTANRIPPAAAACYHTYWIIEDNRLDPVQRRNLKHCCQYYPTIRIT